MKSLPLSCALLVAAWVPAFSAPPVTPSTAPSFGEVLEVNVVDVDVDATDRNGHRVTGLRKDDFELLEDGKRVAISNFDAREAGGEASRAAGGAAAGKTGAAGRSPDDAWNLVIFVDDFNILPAHRTRALRQLREFLDRELAPGDRVMLATYDMGLNIRVPFTSDPAAIAQGLERVSSLAAHGGEHERDRRQAVDAILSIQRDSLLVPPSLPCPQNIATPAHAYAGARRQDVLQTINALTVLVNSLSGVPGRKAVLHVSDGIPLIPGEEVFQFLAEICGGHGNSGFGKSANLETESIQQPNRFFQKPSDDDTNPMQVFDAAALGPESYKGVSQAPLDAQSYAVNKNLQALAAHANAHRVTLYTLQASGLQGTEASDASFGPDDRLLQFPSIGSLLRSNLQDSLQILADDTGGRAILNANNVLPDLSRMREDFTTLYSLGFTPGHTGDGREHKIEVRVKRPGVRLRYRQSYRDKPAFEKVVDRTLAALFYGIEENPLGVAVEIGDAAPAERGEYAVPVRLKIPLFKLAILNQQDTYEGRLQILLATRDDAGGISAVRQIEVPLHIPRKEVLSAMGQYYLYTLTLKMKPGSQHLGLAVRDEIAATTSYLSRPVSVGPAAATASNH
ncbi:MAG TPA: VWA domain-containing protein [Thermoanaerobaculia bacterium]|jgi:VWFA-related protein